MMCNRLLNKNPDNVDALMDRADAYLASEKWDDGMEERHFTLVTHHTKIVSTKFSDTCTNLKK